MNTQGALFDALSKRDEKTALSILQSKPALAHSHGKSPSARFNTEGAPLLAAAELGLPGLVRALLAAGADPRERGALGGNALHWAAWHGYLSIVSTLLEHGLSLGEKDTHYECTPLFWAVHGYSRHGPSPRRDQLAVAALFLELGAEPNPCNKSGTPAFTLLTEEDEEPMRQLLLRHGAKRPANGTPPPI